MPYLDTDGLNSLWTRIKAVFATKSEVPTENTVSGWGFTKNTGTYSKPSGGIPKTDLASAVQTSLGKADTALQSYTETDPTVPSHVKAITADQITAWDSKGESNLTLGETSTTAYRGDRGKIAYDHSQSTHAPTESKTAASGGSTLSLVTTGEKYTWNNKGSYSKPSGGIPKTDLASAVQTSLGKADTALQSFTESDPVFSASPASAISQSQINTWDAKASTTYVDNAISTALTGAAKYCGTLASEAALAELKNFKQGNYWVVSTSWTSATLGKTLDVGNYIFANSDGSTYDAAKFDVIQADIDAIPLTTINALS